jgi:hypothetical protein
LKAMLILVAALVSFSAQAGMDWTDLCAPDVAALAQAAKDYPNDRFDQSRCADQIYHRGTCQVVPQQSGESKSEVIFLVKLRSNAGVSRNYQVSMELDAGANRARAVCRVNQVRRGGVQ